MASSAPSPQSQKPGVRVRSPNYPGIDLGEAIQKVRTVYQAQHLHPATKEVIAKVLGYAGLNGASFGVVSALVKYGLMDQKGEEVRVSTDGQTVIVHRRGDPQYSAVIREAAFRPSLFRELHDLYGDSPPSDHTLRVYLQKKGFNPKVLDSVIRLYRDTLEFVSAETEDDILVSDDLPDESKIQPKVSTTAPQATPVANSIVAPELPNEKIIALPLSEDSSVRIVFTGRITQQDIEHVRAILELNKRAYPKDDGPEQTTIDGSPS
jgi:hypothetical protein